MVTIIVIKYYVITKKLKTLEASLALKQIKEVDAVAAQETS